MKDIVLVSSKPWKHIPYLHQLSEKTGCRVIAFLCSELRINPDIFMVEPNSLYVGDRLYNFAPKEAYDSLQKKFPNANVMLIDTFDFEEVEKVYNRENTVIIMDFEPDNDFSILFCEYCYDDNIGKKTFYFAESRETIVYLGKYLGNKFNYEKILIPSSYNNEGNLEYKDLQKLINMIM